MSIKSFLIDAMGIRGPRNLASWAVAGGLAYYLWIRPEQIAAEERRIAREQAKQRAIEQGLQELDRVKPQPDPQDTGLIVGKQNQR